MWTLLLSRQGDAPGTFVDRRQIDSGQIRIGRGGTCDWVIDDPDGFLSRQHCLITGIGLDLFITDTSTNGVDLNEPAKRIAPQSPVAIRIGDRLLIGNFIITVASESAGLSAQIETPLPAAQPGAGFSQPDSWFDTGAAIDPIWGSGGASKADVHEFLGDAIHDFLAPPSRAPETGGWSEGFGGTLSAAFSKPLLAAPIDDVAFGIPEDWAMPAPAESPASPPGIDPFAMPPAADPFASKPGETDPFAGFGANPASDPFAAPLPSPPVPPVAEDPFAGLMPRSQPFGGADPFADFFGGEAPPPAPPKPAPESTTVPPLGRETTAPPVPAPADFAPAPGAAISPTPAPAGQADAAWAAFAEGAGVEPGDLRLAPDAMRRLGVFYRQVVLGLTDLIQDRAAFKDEFRVERTQLSMGRNNPLKHLPALDSAKLLLSDPLPGFLGSEEAVRTAFEDVKRHQLAMLAGVQRALRAVFDRLSPAEVDRLMKQAETKRGRFGFGRGIDPWSVYQTMFEALKADATSNRNGVMSVAFREGYEEFLRSDRAKRGQA